MKKINILYIDDYELDRELVKDSLEREHGGFEVTEASSKQEFEAILKTREFDVVLSDFNIAGFEGLQVLEATHAHDPRLPVIIVTGTGSEKVAAKAMKQGASDYVIKRPKHIQRLPQTILAAIEKRTLRDQREKAEINLKKSEEKFRVLYNSSPDMYVSVSPDDASILECNETLLNKTGYSREEIIGSPIFKMYHEVCIDEVKKDVFPKFVEAGVILDKELILKRKDGSKISVSLNVNAVRNEAGKILHSISSWRDITERKQVEKKVRDSERRLKAILGSIQAGILVIDAETHTIVDANPAAIKMIGSPKEKIIGHVCYKYICSAEKGKCPVTDLGQKMDNSECILLAANGKEIPILKTAIPILFDGKEFLLGSFIDITEKKKLESQLQQAQKMEAIGILAGGVAHDFNNILTTIIGNANLALTEVGKNDTLRDEVEEIKIAGERAADLTRQLLAFSRKQIIKPKVLNLNELLSGTEKMLGRLLGEDVELLTILEPALWQVEVDPGQIEQVIMNLVVNARDAMPMGGRLTVETANPNLDENYFSEHGIKEQPGSYVVMSVSDNGSGMDKETLKHIFDPFYTTKEFGKGTGLGLSTVYGIVKQNNGFIWVYSEPGQGTTFKVYLPRVKEGAKPEEKEQIDELKLGGSGTVLIVEDDNSLRKLAGTVLKQKGYKVLEAENGEDALKISKKHDGSIHLLITDVVMPKMGGKEVAERLQPLYPKMKVIYMSGYTDDAIVHHGVLADGLNFLEKPFTPDGLARKVREVLDR